MQRSFFGIFFLLTLITSCKPKDIEYISLEDVEILKMGYPRSQVGIKANCYNPNTMGFSLESLEADLSLNNKLLGKVSLSTSLDIPRKDTFQIPLTLDIETLQSLKSLAGWVGSKKDLSDAPIQLKGEALLKRNGIAIRYPVKYSGGNNLGN